MIYLNISNWPTIESLNNIQAKFANKYHAVKIDRSK